MALLVLEAATDGQGGVGLLILEQYVLAVGEIGAELEQACRVDALVVDPGGVALRGDGDVEGFLNRFLVGGEVAGGEVESAGDLIVARHAAVGQEHAGDVQAR